MTGNLFELTCELSMFNTIITKADILIYLAYKCTTIIRHFKFGMVTYTLPPTCKIYINMWDGYVNMPLNYVNMQHH